MEQSVLLFPQLSPPKTVPKILIGEKEMSDDDIYCEVKYPPSQTSGPESTSSQSRSFTTSLNSFRLAGGHLGSIATRLERAITRWARANWADSSSSLNSDISSDSSRSSFRTANKLTRRKCRYPSVADIRQRGLLERTVEARLKAREARKTVPREFNLYTPSEDVPSQDLGLVWERQQIMRTFSLDLMLPHLENLLRNRSHGKSRRTRPGGSATVTELDYTHQSQPHRGRTSRDPDGNASRVDEADGVTHKLEKGKDKMPSVISPPSNALKHSSAPLRDPESGKLPPAWWLDVANPSWEDMRTLGSVSTSFYLNEMSCQLRRAVITSSPFNAGGHFTAGAARKVGSISQARLLFHRVPRARIFDRPGVARRHQSEDRQF
jgi:magnesium transporter